METKNNERKARIVEEIFSAELVFGGFGLLKTSTISGSNNLKLVEEKYGQPSGVHDVGVPKPLLPSLSILSHNDMIS